MRTHLNNIIKKIEYLRGRYDTWNIFSDFINMSALSIRNSMDLRNWKKREEQYLNISKKYKDKELNIFSEMLGELILGLEKEQSDILGQVFMELNISNKWQGQFFTPMNISNLCGEMVIDGLDEEIKENGYIALDEPACGGGAMVIGFANAMKNRGYNYQTELVVNARDLDLKSVQMCYIQLSLLGIPANIQHGNTISLEIFDEWQTPFFITGRWEDRINRDKNRDMNKDKGKIDFSEDDTGQLIIS